MSSQEYDYDEDFVQVRRGEYSRYQHTLQTRQQQYGSDVEMEKTYPPPAFRRLKRERADSVSFSPQDIMYGVPTHSAETPGSVTDDIGPYFSTKHQQFESSFRNPRGRERAPLNTRLWDMQGAVQLERPVADPQNAHYDNDVEMQPLAVELQELAIIEDILSLTMGFSGRYISFRYPAQSRVWRTALSVSVGLVVPSWINPTLQLMAEKIMPLALMHRRVKYFVSTYSQRQAGVVNQALCAAIDTVVKDFYTQITTLENLARTSTESDPYTLQQLWCHLYPSVQTFERLVHLINDILEKDLPPQLPAEPRRVKKTQRWNNDVAAAAGGDGGSQDGEVANIAEDGMPDTDSEYNDEDDRDEDDDDSEDDANGMNRFPDERFVVRGGYTLNVISEMIKLRGGDLSTRQLYEFLLTKASVPFMQMLSHWLNTGELDDGRSDMQGEFMVTRHGSSLGARAFVDSDAVDDFAGKSMMPNADGLSYESVPERTPVFLRPHADKIVRTGAYLNTLRSCGVDLRALPSSPEQTPLSPTGSTMSVATGDGTAFRVPGDAPSGLLHPHMLMREIDQAYLRANHALLGILFRDGRVMDYLQAVKHYLLFEKSDFLTHFLDLANADAEVSRQQPDMEASRLQSLLDLALLNPASVSHDDPLRDTVKVVAESVDLIDTLRLINMGDSSESARGSIASRVSRETSSASGMTLMGPGDGLLADGMFIGLQLQIPFPMDIVLDRVSMSKYRALSRLLFALKQTEQNLVSSWITTLKFEDPPMALPTSGRNDVQLSAKQTKAEALRRGLLLNVHTMRHRILICIQQILYYCFWDVIEPQWAKMTQLMRSAKTVDELCSIHTQHLGIMFQQCGLTAGKLPKIMVELLKRSNRFIDLVSRMSSTKSTTLFRMPKSTAEKTTVSGKLLNDMHTSHMDDIDTQLVTLTKLSDKLASANKDWAVQLKTMVRALNHYARKFDESYLTLAVRLDCSQSDDSYLMSPI
ncbi:gamma tubulin complex Spc97/GCP2 subunit Alp4 [Coemansia sp. Benny D115]|nr:gamma tubulin complex Spc97/GCP2 subunit Alp4 [Coemansia sp. Benny D115]